MRHIWPTIAAVVAAVLGGTTVGNAQHDQHHALTRGSSVTLTACLEKAHNDEGEKFVLTHLADVPAHRAMHGRLVYWIDDVDKIKDHVGRQLRLSGRVTDVSKAEMEVKPAAGKQGGAIVEVEGPGARIETSPDQAAVSTSGRTAREGEIATTVVALELDRVDVVSDRCKLQ